MKLPEIMLALVKLYFFEMACNVRQTPKHGFFPLLITVLLIKE